MIITRLGPALLVLLLAAAGPAHAALDGWKFHAGEPGMPAVLLIHGLAASGTHWTEPKATWSIKHLHRDHRKDAKDRKGDKKGTTVAGITRYPVLAGIESIRISPQDDDAGKSGSFWRYLVDKGYTVATWNQVACMDTDELPSQACKARDTFAPAHASAREALAELARRSGNAPIALLGHSRGGLVARQLLKDRDVPGITRVRWLLTLHTPHQGSGMATLGVALQKKLDKLEDAVALGFLPEPLRKAPKTVLDEVGERLNGAVDGLVALSGMAGARELAANGELLTGLARGEAAPAGVKVVTFGGTSPRFARVHAYVYTARSALATESDWVAEPHELIDLPGDFKLGFAEIRKDGDLLVTDDNARLPWEGVRHHSHRLNHAEVLWSRTVQDEVHAAMAPKKP